MTVIDRIFKSSEGAQIVDVTPDIARALIENANRDNRPIKPKLVKKYAKSMADGDWKFSPETISISRNGRLLNGQHRMMAVIESGITCRFLFATGFDDEVFSVLDRGAARTRADALRIDRKLAEAGTLLCRLSIHGRNQPITDGDAYRASMCIDGVHSELVEFCPTNARVFSSAPFRLAAVARVMFGADREYVFGMYRDLILAHTEGLPPIGHATIRAVLTGRLFGAGGHVQSTNACAAWDVFNPKSSTKSKLMIQFKDTVASEIAKATGYAEA
jgi:hypothetical protein